MNKGFVRKAFSALLICFMVVGLSPVFSTKAADVAISATKETMYAGETFTLTLENAKGDVTWKTSNKKVATVKEGKVTAVAGGTAKITAKYKGATYTCKVTVKNPHINCQDATLYVDGELQLKVYGDNVKEYESSDEKVAEVSEDGLVTAIGTGEATITVTCKDSKVYRCYLKVKENLNAGIPLSSIAYSKIWGRFYKDSGRFDDYDYMKDNKGSIHKEVISFYGNGETGVEYDVNKKYSYISGVYYLLFSRKDINTQYTLSIYGDEVLLWSGTVAKGIDPIEFQVDISKVNKMKMIVIDDFDANVAIGDLYLIP